MRLRGQPRIRNHLHPQRRFFSLPSLFGAPSQLELGNLLHHKPDHHHGPIELLYYQHHGVNCGLGLGCYPGFF